MRPHHTRYRLARYRPANGDVLVGELPKDVQRRGHFGTVFKGCPPIRIVHWMESEAPFCLERVRKRRGHAFS